MLTTKIGYGMVGRSFSDGSSLDVFNGLVGVEEMLNSLDRMKNNDIEKQILEEGTNTDLAALKVAQMVRLILFIAERQDISPEERLSKISDFIRGGYPIEVMKSFSDEYNGLASRLSSIFGKSGK